jgi:hypothetical protein
LKLLAALALSTIGACRATSAAPAVGPASPPPPSCATRPLAFRPRPSVSYHARTVQQTHNIYETNLTFTPDGDGWHAVEGGFSMNRPMPVETFGDLPGSELRWRLDRGGAPSGEPEQSGSAKPGYLANMTYYAFAPAGLATGSTCVGTTWEARWEENSRIRTFHYRIESADADRVRVRVDGLVKTPHNEWRIDGTVEVSTEDGLTSTGDLHVTGPGAPAVNDYPRSVSIAPARERYWRLKCGWKRIFVDEPSKPTVVSLMVML